MSSKDLGTLEREFNAAREALTEATQRLEQVRGEVKPLPRGEDPKPMAPEIIAATNNQRAAEQAYTTARDAFRAASS